MSRLCMISGKGVLVGNKVSHANNKTKRRFLPNLQETSFWSETLKRRVRLRISTTGIRTIERAGGIDAYIKSIPLNKLPQELQHMKEKI